MSRFSEIGRRLWSLVSPDVVSVRLITRSLPSGQLEISPEFIHRGRTLDPRLIAHRADDKFIDGYRVRLPNQVLSISREYQNRTLRLRPRAVQEWVNKYAANGVPVVSGETGRPVVALTAQVELDLDLRPDDVLVAKAILSTPDGVELEKERIEPIPNELSSLQNQPAGKIREVRKSENLKGSFVVQNPPENRLRIDGNAEQIQG